MPFASVEESPVVKTLPAVMLSVIISNLIPCLALDDVSIPEQWHWLRCFKLPQFKKGRKALKGKPVPSAINETAMQCTTISVCNGKANITDRIIEYHNVVCKSGHFFHLTCLGLKRVPQNSKTAWQCFTCRGKNAQRTSAQPTTCTSSALNLLQYL